MPSFCEHTRLDGLHVPGVATRVATRSIAITCAPTSLAAPTAAAALPRSSLLPYIPQSKEQDRTTPTAHQKKRGIPKREPRLANAPVTCITFPAVRVQKLGSNPQFPGPSNS